MRDAHLLLVIKELCRSNELKIASAEYIYIFSLDYVATVIRLAYN